MMQLVVSCCGVGKVRVTVCPSLVVVVCNMLTVTTGHKIIFLISFTTVTPCSSPCYHVRDLHNNSLSGAIPNSLGSAKSLQMLYVRCSPQI